MLNETLWTGNASTGLRNFSGIFVCVVIDLILLRNSLEECFEPDRTLRKLTPFEANSTPSRAVVCKIIMSRSEINNQEHRLSNQFTAPADRRTCGKSFAQRWVKNREGGGIVQFPTGGQRLDCAHAIFMKLLGTVSPSQQMRSRRRIVTYS